MDGNKYLSEKTCKFLTDKRQEIKNRVSQLKLRRKKLEQELQTTTSEINRLFVEFIEINKDTVYCENVKQESAIDVFDSLERMSEYNFDEEQK